MMILIPTYSNNPQALTNLLLDNAILLPTTVPTTTSEILPDAVSSAAVLFTTIPDPVTFLSTILLVTASDMMPFVPCQPLAITLGAKLGLWAFPICVFGQTLAGVLAFRSARALADADGIQDVLDNLGNGAFEKFQEFRRITAGGGAQSEEEMEGKVLLALIGLRLAPFFPFSAGNYLLGGATGVGVRPFFLATLIGCVLSNFVSVSVGMGGMELLKSAQ